MLLEKKSNSESLFRNNLLDSCPSQPETSASQSIECCIVDVMRVVRIIPISDLDENTFMCSAKRFVHYLKPLSGHVIHLIFGNYEKSEEISISKRRSQKGTERNITSLNQTVPTISLFK